MITASACPRRSVRRDRKWRQYDHIRRRHIALTASFLNEKHRVAARQSVGESGMAFSGIIVKKMVSPRGVGWTVKAAASASRLPLPAILHVSCQLLDRIDIRGLEEYLTIVSSTLIIFFSSLKNSFTMVVKFNFECSDLTINSPLLCPARTTKV